MEFLQNIEGERAGHAKGEVVDEHSISKGVCFLSLFFSMAYCMMFSHAKRDRTSSTTAHSMAYSRNTEIL